MILVIFGASGDLTRRKLMPSLFQLYELGKLTGNFSILGVSRTSYEDETYRNYILEALRRELEGKEEEKLTGFVGHLYYHHADPSKGEEYPGIAARMRELEEKEEKTVLYYLATPPSLYGVIPRLLKAAGMNPPQSRIIVEKPFGYDLESARELNRIYADVFQEHQIYRIDHFLGKETVQNILALRFANGILEPLWNRNYISYVEVTAVENMGIGTRAGYFDATGTLRDMVQNHLLQLVAITAMEPPVTFNPDNFRNEIKKVLDSVTPFTEQQMRESIIRGQYIASGTTPGYRQEKGIPPASRTETYVAMRLQIDNWRWSGVPFFLRTGKQLPTKVTEIVVHFKPAPHQMFRSVAVANNVNISNMLVIRIQPNEGVVLKFGLKVPGAGFTVQDVEMDFSYSQLSGTTVLDAYSRLIEDCISGDPTLFTRSDVVESSWQLVDPVLEFWKQEDAPLYGYPAGTWGPEESKKMVDAFNTDWTNPCKNLTDTDKYCEL